MVNIWGPAAVVMLGLVAGLIYNNSRITDLREHVDKRLDDLKDFIRSEFKRIDERIDRFESPIAKR